MVKVWTVNDISIHPVYTRTISTAGADGTIHFWDLTGRKRLSGFPSTGGAVTATAFNRTGGIFAYAVGYDWSMGCGGNRPDYPIRVMLHPVTEDEVKPRRT